MTLGAAGAASAQLPEDPYVSSDGQLTVAGELSATISPPDNDAFFNYTDYEHNGLRTARARLLGEWRMLSRMSLLGELRAENADAIDLAALYVRWRPWEHRQFDVQVGRIPPVLGAFARHAYGRDNLVIGTPLAYQYLISLRPDALPATADDVLRMRGRGWRSSFPIGSTDVAPGVPLVTGFHWDTGAEASWRSGRMELSGALTRGAPATPAGFDARARPTWSGRAAITAATGLVLGASGARGRWIGRDVLRAVPDTVRHDAVQTVIGFDGEFGFGRWLVRGEWLRSAFQVPAVAAPWVDSPLIASSGFVEARYRWRPRWQIAARAEHLGFSDIRGTLLNGDLVPWDAPIARLEAVVGFRATRSIEVRGGWQENRRFGRRLIQRGYPALQVLYWF